MSTLIVDNIKNTSDVSVMTVNSSGYANYPAKPIIAGRMGSIAAITTAQKIPFDEFYVQRGITYDSGTRRFTVPVSGIYRITWDVFFNSGTAASRAFVVRNADTPTYTGTGYLGQSFSGGTTAEVNPINVVAELNANDYIVFYLHTGQIYNATADRFNTFSIEMIA